MYFKLQESKCRIWFKENGARLRRQSCSVRILPDPKRSSSDRRKSYILKVRKRSSVNNADLSGKGEKPHTHDDATYSWTEDEATMTVSVDENDSNTELPENDVAAAVASEETSNKRDAGNFLTDINVECSTLSEANEREHPANSSDWDERQSAASADSSMLSCGLEVLPTRDKFFDQLPFDKQILLLKRTRHLTTASSAEARELAAELKVPFRSVHSWLKSKTIRQSRMRSLPPSRQKIDALDQLATSQALTEERALLLSYQLDLSVSTICNYLKRKRSEIGKEELCSSPAQQNLSEAGSDLETEEPAHHNSDSDENVLHPSILVPQHPSGSHESLSSGICLPPGRSNDSKDQRKTTARPCDSNDGNSLQKRRFVLMPRQRKLLMQYFRRKPSIAPADAAILADKLGLPVKAVQLWFHRKRMETNPADISEMKESSVTNEVDN